MLSGSCKLLFLWHHYDINKQDFLSPMRDQNTIYERKNVMMLYKLLMDHWFMTIETIKIASTIKFQLKFSLKLPKKNNHMIEIIPKTTTTWKIMQSIPYTSSSNPLSLELPSEFHKGEDDCSCNLNCKDRGKDHHGGCQKIERKKAKKQRRNHGCKLLLDKSFT